MRKKKILKCHHTVHISEEEVVREISITLRGFEIANFSAWVGDDEEEVMDWIRKKGQLSDSFLPNEFRGDANELLSWVCLEMGHFFNQINAFFIKGKFFSLD